MAKKSAPPVPTILVGMAKAGGAIPSPVGGPKRGKRRKGGPNPPPMGAMPPGRGGACR